MTTELACRPSALSGDVSITEARDELQSILADPEFQCTERNKKFLRFVAEELFAGREGALKAYSVAVDVFGRPASFDATTDPIVRIEATRLRAALARYYELRGHDRSIIIELPKGRYVPVFSRREPPLGQPAGAADAQPARETAAPGRDRLGRARLLFRLPMLAGATIAAAALFAALGLYDVFRDSNFSEKPIVSLGLQFGGAETEEALAMRDSLMIALSGFQTLRLAAHDAHTASTGEAQFVQPAWSRYEIVLKYRADGPLKVMWWQVVDPEQGEALRSGEERVSAAGAFSADPKEELVSRLAVRLASAKGIINTIETARELQHPSLGNGCVLRANLALSTQEAQALQSARSCLGRTLRFRPHDADAHAMMAAVLLALDPAERPTELTQAAVTHAARAAVLAPESDRSYMAQMLAAFRTDRTEAAIMAGRRALDLNPYNTAIAARLAAILFSVGLWEESVALAEKVSQFAGVQQVEAELTLAFDA